MQQRRIRCPRLVRLLCQEQLTLLILRISQIQNQKKIKGPRQSCSQNPSRQGELLHRGCPLNSTLEFGAGLFANFSKMLGSGNSVPERSVQGGRGMQHDKGAWKEEPDEDAANSL